MIGLHSYELHTSSARMYGNSKHRQQQLFRNVVVVFVMSTLVLGLCLLVPLYGYLVGNVDIGSNISHLQLFILALVAEILETVLMFTLLSSSV